MMTDDNGRLDPGASLSENAATRVEDATSAAPIAGAADDTPQTSGESATKTPTKTAARRERSTTRSTTTRVRAKKTAANAQLRLEANGSAPNEDSVSPTLQPVAPTNGETRNETPGENSRASYDGELNNGEAKASRNASGRAESSESTSIENEAQKPTSSTRSAEMSSKNDRSVNQRSDNAQSGDVSSVEEDAPRAVRLPEVRAERDERRNDSRADNRNDRGLRFRGRDGRAELRRNDTRGFRARFEGGANGTNNANSNSNRNARNESRSDGRSDSATGRLQNNRNDGNRNDGNRNNAQNQRDNNRDNRNLDRDLVRNSNDFDLTALEEKDLNALHEIARELGIEIGEEVQKSDLILRILEEQAENSGNLFKKGILEIMPDGKGFLRTEGYLSSNEDVYISQSQIKRFNLKTGDLVSGQVRAPKEMERFYGLLRVEACNGEAPDLNRVRKEFEKLTPIFPNEKFNLETTQENITARIIDLVSPIGKGQRGLIVAPPKAGKTSLIKNVANSIMANHPDVHLIVLLIDERPEEVTDIARSVRGEVVASTFDEMPENHIRVADMVLEKAKRMVEQKKDVVILLDSITRLSRASNLVVNPSGRTMSGGLDPAAMHKPKRLFGAARNIEEGGSLTILATVLIDTGSRMDEYIFEELKGTGNMDLVLDRNLFDQRIFPAIDINKSGTRRDDLLLSKEDLTATYHLRRTLSALDNDKAINLLIDRLRNTKTNGDFMAIVQKSSRQQNAPAPSPAP